MKKARPVSPVLVLAILAVLPATPGGPLMADDFEQPPVLKASDVLPPEVRKGDHYEIQGEVVNDGFMNRFSIASDFGRFEAYGTLMLAVRIQEIGALAELSEVSKAEVFAESALAAITSPVKAISDFAVRPEETIKGIGAGLGRMWGRVKRTAGEIKDGIDEAREEKDEEAGEAEADDDAAELAKDYAKKYFGTSSAERRWSEKLGVDPYTTNETLRKGIREVARVDAAGGFSVKLAGLPSIPRADVIASVNQLVWGKDPGELKELNTRSLAEMGAGEELIERFYENPFFLSPSRQTRFVTALAGLEGVAERTLAVELAAASESEEEVLFQVGAAVMLGWLHGGEASIARLAPSRVIPVALTVDGRLAVAAPLDYTVWTEDLAAGVDRLAELGTRLGAQRREVWFLGEVSDRCRGELEARGWKVHSEVEPR